MQLNPCNIKPQISQRYFFKNYFVCFFSFLFFLLSCKKDPVVKSGIVSAHTNSLSKTDGIITVQTGILPPVTQQCFIPNGGTSITEFQIISSQHILLYNLYFSATYPHIQYITLKNFGVSNVGGNIEFNGGGEIAAGAGTSLMVQVHYNNADSNISGTIAQLNLTSIIYRTDDEQYHSFFPEYAGKAQPMCIVNNIPNIVFRDPLSDSLHNGFKEIAEIKLTGDTDWTFNTLPLNFWSPYDAAIPKSKLIVKNRGITLSTLTDSVSLQPGCSAQTLINFTGGFHHTAGATDILKIFAPVKSTGFNLITTTMSPLNSMVWTDDLGVKITGVKNDRFFKQQTGQSNYH